MHINYWNRKYGKKNSLSCFASIKLLSFFFLSQEGVLRVFVVEKCLLGVCACACVCMGNRTRCEHYANASHKHSFNSPYMHLSCLWVHLFRSYIQYISHACVCVSVCCAAQCDVDYGAGWMLCWQPRCDRGSSCLLQEVSVYHEQTEQKNPQ